MQLSTPMLRAAAITAALLMPIAAGAADSPAPSAGDGRFTLAPSGDGFMRLDRETGAMTWCERESGAWRCNTIGDGEEALRSEAERLKRENEDLKASKKHLEEMLGLGDGPGAPAPGAVPSPGFQVPDEADVDRAFDYIERMMKKLKERLEKLDKDEGTGEAL